MNEKIIKEYCVICENSIDELNNEVMDYIEDDWQPFGGISVVSYTENKVEFCQTIVKYK